MRLAGLGMPQLARLALTGKLRPRHLGLAIEGASEYHEAIASGDVASSEALALRAGCCATCPNATSKGFTLLGRGRLKWYCGEPFEDQGEGRPCGCLVGVTVNRKAVKDKRVEHAAGLLYVASKGCPTWRFGPVEPAEV